MKKEELLKAIERAIARNEKALQNPNCRRVERLIEEILTDLQDLVNEIVECEYNQNDIECNSCEQRFRDLID